ncbi:laccase-like protein [Xylariaceae sp. FL1272]|nr:laccase-like protein [Xylariaceae sp. FL1272]
MPSLQRFAVIVAGFLARIGDADETCNTAANRGCWSSGFDINTDYESATPSGITRFYSWDVEELENWLAPDGELKNRTMLINGMYPGPTITADWGDTISVTVTNKLTVNGTGIHWHGLRQLGSNLEDGVGGITECPIPPGQSKTYTFNLTQYGTTWYHSHFSSQYANGVFGAIQINGPSSANYDIDLGTYPISDFYLASAEQIVATSQGGAATEVSSNVMFNGTNINLSGNSSAGSYSTINLMPGKTHLLRLYNPSAQHHYQVSVVGHNMTVIETDLVPIAPVTVDNIFLAIGQRAHVLLTANQKAGNYWMNITLPASGKCGVSKNLSPAAIVHYTNVTLESPTDVGTKPADTGCLDSLMAISQAADPETFGHTSENTVAFSSAATPTTHWVINGSMIYNSTMRVDWEKPLLDYVLSNNMSYPLTDDVITINQKNEWTYWIMESTSTGPHPIHLHGHDFLVLGVSAANAGFFSDADVASLNFDNPTRRDVTMIPPQGWVVLAFKSDNPGAWLFHCHIAWHGSNGMALTFLERVSEQEALISSSQLRAYEDNCAAWSEYWNGQTSVKQIDSGV